MPQRKMPKEDFEALAAFRYQLRRFLRFSEEASRRSGVTPLQYQLMLQIKGFPGRQWATVVELAERLQAKHHGMVALVSRSEAAGLVKRHPSRVDQRQVEVRLTAEGERCLERLARLHRDELESIRQGFAVPQAAAPVAGERLAGKHGASPGKPSSTREAAAAPRRGAAVLAAGAG